MENMMRTMGMDPSVMRRFGMEPERFLQISQMMQGAADAAEDGSTMKDFMRGLNDMSPLPKFASPEDVRQQAAARSANIFESYDMLNAILERHEATIQKRWAKKGNPQRRKILATAWGGKMATTHRPDFGAFRREGYPAKDGVSQHRDAYMWPFINEEDLTKPRTLLHFLNARGRTPPGAFAASDLEAMHYGLSTKGLKPIFLNEHVMLFRGQDTAATYGKLIHWDDHPDARGWSESRREMQPGEGLLVLESQERTLAFLLNCAKEILHDLENPLAHPLQPAPEPLQDSETGTVSLAVLSAESPYRAPAQIDFRRIQGLLEASRDRASDHLWALREDPGYFASCVLDVKEHRQEMMIDIRGLAHPLFRNGKEDVVWARAVNRVIADAHLALELWTSLCDQAKKLGKMKKCYESSIDRTKDLPKPYLAALLRFQHYLHRAADMPLANLKMAHAASPPLRYLYCRDAEDNPMTQKTSYGPKPNARPDERTMYLTWLFRKLTEDDEGLFLAGLGRTADALQHMMDTDPAAKTLVSSYLAAIISELSVITECLRQVENYQPWANTFEYFTIQNANAIEAEYKKTSDPWVRVLLALKKSEGALGRHANVTDGRFNYPIEKRRTKDNVGALQRAEQALDTFWGKVDEILHLNIKNLDGLAAKDLLSNRQLQRTPDWVEPTSNNKTVEVTEMLKPLSEIYFDLEHRTERTQKHAEVGKTGKAKEKTRGKTDFVEPSGEVNIQEPNDLDPQPTFAVDQRALKVFKTLFYMPSTTGSPGEVPWPDFLHALVSVGFQPEKLYGSVWQFSPTKLDVERSIQFHEPHPSGKIPFRTARRHGRRLNRAYGWHGKMFTLVEKKQT